MKIKNDMELIQPEKQNIWGITAVLNFILGGTAAGFYLLNFFLKIFNEGTFNIFHNFSIQIISPALVITGFILLTFDAGRPLRSYQLFNNLLRSFMSIEVFSGLIFIFFIALELIFGNFLFSILAAISASILMMSQGFILYYARAIIAWNVYLIPFVTIISNFTMAIGLFLILSTQEKITLKKEFFVIALILVILDKIILYYYITLYSTIDRKKIIKILNKSFSKIFIVSIGNIIAFFFLLFLLPMVLLNHSLIFLNTISVLTGIFILISGICQKFSITIGNDYLRGIQISRIQNKKNGSSPN
jgi:phenylacetyl-CoA:acceptor oxidoreductase subunit 2